MAKFVTFTACLVLATLLFPTPGYAYLDPGTGSIIVQAIIGAVAAAGTVLALYWQKVKNFFRRDQKDSSDRNNRDKI